MENPQIEGSCESILLDKLRTKRMHLSNEIQNMEHDEKNLKERLISARAERNGIDYAFEQIEKIIGPKK